MKKYGLFIIVSISVHSCVLSKPILHDAPVQVIDASVASSKATIIDMPHIVTSSQDKIQGLYMYACYQHRKGDLQKSHATYEKIFSYTLTPEQHFVYDGYLRLLFETNQFGRVVSLVKEKKAVLDKILAKDIQLRLFYAQSCLYTGDQQRAEQEFAALAKKHKDNEMVAYYMAEALMKSGKMDEALLFVQECLANKALKRKHFFFHFIASKIHHKKNDYEQALSSIEQSLSNFPRFGQGILFKAMLYEQQSKIDGAIKGYSDYLDLMGSDQEMEKHLVQLLLSQQRFGDAADRLRKSDRKDAAYYFDLALLELHAKRPENAFNDVCKCIELQPDFVRGRLLKLDVLLALRKVPEALELVQGWLLQDPHNLSVVNVLMLMRKAKVAPELLAQVLEQVLAQKQSLLLHASLADLSFESSSFVKAHEHYSKALALATEIPIKTKLTYQQAYTLVKLNQHKQAKAMLKLLADKAEYPAACNLLAYLYAKEKKKLPEALKLVEKALSKDPKRAAFYDTKGYILAKMGKKEEASLELKKALTYKPHSHRIMKHAEALELK